MRTVCLLILLIFLGVDSSVLPARSGSSVRLAPPPQAEAALAGEGLSYGEGSLIVGGDIFRGKVIDRSNRKTLAFANIGILNGNYGTCADAKGNYTIDLSGVKENDRLICSHIGYKPDTIKISAFRQKYSNGVAIFPLRRLVPPPENVMDFDDEMTTKVLGNDSDSKSKTTKFVNNNLGTEVGVTIRVRSELTYLTDLSFNVVKNNYDSLVIRVNLYYLHNEIPYDKINSEDIIVRTNIQEGRVTVDLLPHKLIVDEAFFVSLEWVSQLGPEDNSDLLFTGGGKSHLNYCRRASHSDWIEYKGFGPAIAVTGIYE